MKRIYMIPEIKVLVNAMKPFMWNASVPYGGDNDDQEDESNSGLFDSSASDVIPSSRITRSGDILDNTL